MMNGANYKLGCITVSNSERNVQVSDTGDDERRT
jgi:hypothetical protein